MLSPWGRSSPKRLSAWNNSNFLRFVSIKIWVLNFDVFSSTSLMAHKEEPLQGKARKLLTTHHVLGHSFLLEHIWNDLLIWYFLLQKGKKYDGRCFCILQIGSFREESESISAQMTYVDNLMSRLISSIAGIYESFSDVGESRVWIASKNLMPCRMHWNAFLIAQIIAKCHSFPNMYGML